LAANLHLALASPSVFTVEVDETYNPLMTEMVLRPVEIADGAAKPPSGPGLGVDLSWDWIFDHPYMDRPGIGAGVRPGDGG
jgi:D-galactarolactone cycloisomerase